MGKISKTLITAIGAVMVVLLQWVDAMTGSEISFSLFYFIPISFTVWYAGRIPGIFIAMLSALGWYTAEIQAGAVYSHALIPFWNTGMRLTIFLLIVYSIDKNRILLDRQTQLAQTDFLTGLNNSRSFEHLVEQELKTATRYNRSIAVAFIDLDDFKKINDVYGHKRGDDFLKGVSSCIRNNLRSSDIVARMGGDEFAICFPGAREEEVTTILERTRYQLQNTLKEFSPILMSVGVILTSQPELSYKELLKQADELMYQAKKDGKGKAVYRKLQ